jgi:hypothetical protein
MAQKLHDSGKRREFKSGAVRDRGDLKPRPDLISPHAQMREGTIMTLGAQKYALRNWEKGLPISECLASAQRHIEQFKRGDTDEDHIAQARWNLGVIIHFEEEIRAGRMDSEIDDMPKYAIPKLGDRRVNSKIGIPEVFCQMGIDLGLNPSIKAGIPNKAPTFYICGPMRGIENFNFPVFDEVAKYARARGLTIISPAELDREHGIDPVADPDSVNRANRADPNLIQTIVQRDCEVILGLKKDRGDGLILLSGWTKSTGGRAEVALALWLGLKFKLPHLGDLFLDASSSWIRRQLFHQPAEGE